MGVTFPGESVEYRAARNELLEAEKEERRMMERVAAARRALPPGGIVAEDYAFRTADDERGLVEIRFSELFKPGKDTLVLYNFMFPRHPEDDSPKAAWGKTADLPLEEQPCPSCTAFIDQLEGAAEHVCQNLNLAIVAKTPIENLLDFADERGWHRLPFLSSAENTYARDYNGEDEAGSQQPMMNVFRRTGDEIRHFWGSELFFEPTEPGQEPRHVGTLEPLWTLFDLTPEGRPDWREKLSYT
jgi:predicted dithiol-disulfide oxidoreductase (DUF899 family)